MSEIIMTFYASTLQETRVEHYKSFENNLSWNK
jgi:hypothetical protein